MVYPRRLAATWLFACAIGSVSFAQERLTLEQAIQRAVTHNPRALAADADVAAADARAREARSGFLPRVDLTETWQRGNQPVYVFSSLLMQRRFSAADFALDQLNHPDAFTNFRTGVSVEQTLYDSGRTRTAARSAGLQHDRVGADRERVLAGIRVETVRAYAHVMGAAADVTAAMSAHAAATEDFARVKQRRDAGLETDAALLAVQVVVQEAEVARIRAAGSEDIARAQLNALIGVSLDTRFEIDPLTPGDLPSLESAVAEAEAIRNRPEIHQAALAVNFAQVTLEGTRRAFLPSILAMGSVESNGSSFGSRASAWGAGLQLRWNVFSGGADASRLAGAVASLRSAEAQQDEAETTLRLEARTAVISARAAAAAERASRLAVDQAQESQRIVRNRYEAGLATSTDLLRAAETVTRAEASRTRAVIDTRIAFAELARALGRETIQ